MIALFPGQGSQQIGMGKEFYENFSYVREVFEEASEAIKKDLKKLCFEGPEDELKLTENTQPSLVTVGYSCFQVGKRETGFVPQVVAGHSLGEYTALLAAGSIPLSTTISWVHERGKAMQTAVAPGVGKMAAILGKTDEEVLALCKQAHQESGKVVEPANFNGPGQVVIAGEALGVEKALKILTQQGGKAKELPVSAPFHCSLMRPAREKMAALFREGRLEPQTPEPGYVPNRTAKLENQPQNILELLIDQIDHPVLWRQSMEALFQQGQTKAIEFGPGAVLQGLAKRIGRDLKIQTELAGLSDLASLRKLEGKNG